MPRTKRACRRSTHMDGKYRINSTYMINCQIKNLSKNIILNKKINCIKSFEDRNYKQMLYDNKKNTNKKTNETKN